MTSPKKAHNVNLQTIGAKTPSFRDLGMKTSTNQSGGSVRIRLKLAPFASYNL